MKRNILWIGMLAIALAFGMTVIACDDGNNDNGGTTPQTATYIGTSGGTTYTLTIDGDSYVLTLTAANGATKTSSGTVTKNGNALTLTPSYSGADTFTITVSPSGITDIDGEITLDNGDKEDPPDTVTPKPPAPPNGSNPPLKVTAVQVYTYDDDGDSERTYTAFAGTGTAMDVKALISSFTPGDDARYDLGKIGTISGDGKLTLELPSTIADDKLFPMPNEYGVNGKVGWVNLVVSNGAYELGLENDSGGVIIEYIDRDINANGVSVTKGWNYFVLSSYDDPPQIISDISNFKWVIYDNGPGSGNGPEESLPASNGINDVSGKTFYRGRERTVFSVTAAGAESGTYTVTAVDNGTYASGVKFTYNTQIETGTYSWNGETKTVTLKPETVASQGPIGPDGPTNPDGSVTVENNYGPLQNRAGFRSEWQAMINGYIQEMGQAAVNELLASMGFSSVSAYIDYMVNEEFGNKTNPYSFSTDGVALFLAGALPANKGANEFSGQTYYGISWDNGSSQKDENYKYVFTASGYTYTQSWDGTVHQTITGSYAYDSGLKQVWLRPETIDGKNRAQYYAEQTAYNGHHYPDDNVARAVQTNNAFSSSSGEDYNSANKTIGWEGR